MSFIDMMSDQIWTDAEITKRTESIVRSVMPLDDELVLNRKIQGEALGQYVLTDADKADIAKLAQVGFLAQQEGKSARDDMILLLNVFSVENAEKIMLNPNSTEEEIMNAQNILDSISPDVLFWVEKRRAARTQL